MSTIVGLSNREIKALADSARALGQLYELTNNDAHLETSNLLAGILKRSSSRWGDPSENIRGQRLLSMIEAILPPDEPEEEEDD